jgi:hypothetical protein
MSKPCPTRRTFIFGNAPNRFSRRVRLGFMAIACLSRGNLLLQPVCEGRTGYPVFRDEVTRN